MRTFLILLVALIGLAGCGSPKKFQTYDGPQVTRVLVLKEKRLMYLMHNETVLKTYRFELGFNPEDHKAVEGDGRTPEGVYFIDRRNPQSLFYLSLGISYPNRIDVARARAMGKSPGGDIFIHGTPRKYRDQTDWTWGCIAVSNKEMREIYSMVQTGTQIVILP